MLRTENTVVVSRRACSIGKRMKESASVLRTFIPLRA